MKIMKISAYAIHFSNFAELFEKPTSSVTCVLVREPSYMSVLFRSQIIKARLKGREQHITYNFDLNSHSKSLALNHLIKKFIKRAIGCP